MVLFPAPRFSCVFRVFPKNPQAGEQGGQRSAFCFVQRGKEAGGRLLVSVGDAPPARRDRILSGKGGHCACAFRHVAAGSSKGALQVDETMDKKRLQGAICLTC
jgi:hypothetical protein